MRIPFNEITHEEYTDARYKGQPFTGTAFDALEECEFASGRMHGIRREFFADGSIRWFAHYCEGREEGEGKEFFPNGRLRVSSSYRSGIIVRSVEFGPNGQKVMEYESESGICNEWRLDGTLRKITTYKPASGHWHREVMEDRYFDSMGQPILVYTDEWWTPVTRSNQA